MTDQIKWKAGSELVPTPLLPAFIRAEKLYIPGGYICEHCGWRTERVGFSGVQASRGHMKAHANTRSWVGWFRALHVVAATVVILTGFVFGLSMSSPTLEVVRAGTAALAIVIAVIAAFLNDRFSDTRLAVLLIGWAASLASAWMIQIPASLVAIEPTMWVSLGGLIAGFWTVKPIARSLRRRRVDRGRRRYLAIWVPTSEEAQEEYEDWAAGRSNVFRVPERKGRS